MPEPIFTGYVLSYGGMFSCEIFNDENGYYAYVNGSLCDDLPTDKQGFLTEFGRDYGWHLYYNLPEFEEDENLRELLDG